MLDQSSSSYATNYLIFQKDMSAYDADTSNLAISFTCGDHGDEYHSTDVFQIRGSSSDPWFTVANLDGCAGTITYDLDYNLRLDGYDFSSTFAFRFVQYDNGSYSSDGRSFDNIVIEQVGLPVPTWYKDADADLYSDGATT